MRQFIIAAIFAAAIFAIGNSSIYSRDLPALTDSIFVIPEFSAASYTTANEAAVHAIAESYSKSNQVEYGGIVYLNPDGSYGYTVPATSHIDDAVWINHITRPAGSRIIADYHTHPCLPYTHYPQYFSPNDVFIGKFYNINAYMGNLCSGKVAVFDKDIDSADISGLIIHYPSGEIVKLAQGRFVGKIALTKEPIIVEAKPKPEDYQKSS